MKPDNIIIRKVDGVMPTQARVIAGIASACLEARGEMPTHIRLSPGTWSQLAMDYYVPRCPCPNCREPGPMVVGGVPVTCDPDAADGRVFFDFQGRATMVIEGYSYVSGV